MSEIYKCPFELSPEETLRAQAVINYFDEISNLDLMYIILSRPLFGFLLQRFLRSTDSGEEIHLLLVLHYLKYDSISMDFETMKGNADDCGLFDILSRSNSMLTHAKCELFVSGREESPEGRALRNSLKVLCEETIVPFKRSSYFFLYAFLRIYCQETPDGRSLGDFVLEKAPCGIGSQGAVFRGWRVLTGQEVAVKKVDIYSDRSKPMQDGVFVERCLLRFIENTLGDPAKFNIMGILNCFFEEKHSAAYIVMPFCGGGTLDKHVERMHSLARKEAGKDHDAVPNLLSKWIAVMAAELLLGLETLHKLDIVYRDMKPENVLMDDNGSVCITDFGLSFRSTRHALLTNLFQEDKVPDSGRLSQRDSQTLSAKEIPPDMLECANFARVLSKQSTLLSNSRSSMRQTVRDRLLLSCSDGRCVCRGHCQMKDVSHAAGTPGWWAPEMLCGAGYTCCADWWSFGLVIYYLFSNSNPFIDKEKETAMGLSFSDVVNFRSSRVLHDPVELPDDVFPPEAADMLRKLLERDENARLGAKGAEEVRQHPFFKDIDWEKLKRGLIPHEYTPTARSPSCVEYTEDKEFESGFSASSPDRLRLRRVSDMGKRDSASGKAPLKRSLSSSDVNREDAVLPMWRSFDWTNAEALEGELVPMLSKRVNLLYLLLHKMDSLPFLERVTRNNNNKAGRSSCLCSLV